MGWNDRLPTDPYLPPDDYYRNGEEEYHAWLEYVEMRLNEEQGLTSQNIDPSALPQTTTETPEQRGIFARMWAAFFGQEVSESKRQEENENLPF